MLTQMRDRGIDPPHKEQDRQQEEQTGFGIFHLGYPRHRFDRHRVERPERRTQPRALHAQAPQNPPQQYRAEAMHQNIHQVIWQRVQSPQRVFRPKNGKRQRTDIGGRRSPDFFQPERPDNAGISR